MRFQVLGCFGSIGNGHNTTSFLVDDDILIDAGSGLGELSLDALIKIDHVFLSHAHMDHIALLPMLADSTVSQRNKPIVLHGTKQTLDALSDHVFNWDVYPDFREICSADHAAMEFSVFEPEMPMSVKSYRGNERHISAIPVYHSIPTVAFHLSGGTGSLVVATDMTVSDAFWPAVNAIDDLRYLLIETAFQDARIDLCAPSGHLCPSLLRKELLKLQQSPEIFVVHMKTSAEPQIRKEIAALDVDFDIRFLADGDILNF